MTCKGYFIGASQRVPAEKVISLVLPSSIHIESPFSTRVENDLLAGSREWIGETG